MAEDRPLLLGLDDAALTRALGGPGRALAVLKSLARGADPTEDPELPSGLRARVAAHTRFTPLQTKLQKEIQKCNVQNAWSL